MKNKPDIRFDGFIDDWELCQFKNIVDVRSGRDYKHLNEGDIPVYGTGGYMLSVDESLSKNEDAVGIGRKGTIDKPYLLKAPFWTVDTLFYAIPRKNYVLEFVHSIFNTINWRKYDESTGVPSLSKSTINSVICCVPVYKEQTQIGAFFQSLDNLITLHQRELENYKLLKKGFLQKLFPSNGDTNPLIRFDGFTDAWELRRLSELFSRGGSGGTPRSTNKAYYNGKIPFLGISDISNSNGFIDKTEKYITEEGLNNSSAWIVPAGSISLAMYASVGKLAILNTDVATSQAFYNMVFNDENLRNYVYQSLSKANESGEWTKLISTGTQANLNADKVKNFDISKPTNKEEMAMISSFFMALDNLITLHQRELDNYKELKKGFLQKMFV
ncbi:restriction endonuclease subunit S [Erysipelothrix rhusiopathiae]|nr:restriction endonuclease subunit S [Erysipelothrix rhusiopathiae]